MIPIANPIFAKNTSKYLNECLKTGWVSSKGPFVERFERKFATYVGTKYAVSCTSGTAALHLSLVALNVGPGDEVITTAFTMISPVFAILYTGATPVLLDVDHMTWNMDVSQIEKKITKKTKAIIVVHIYGHPADMDPIMALAKKYNLFVVEDGAEALGSEYKGRKIGSIGHVSCFSFYANKLITTGEGGMVVTSNKNIAGTLGSLRDMAHSPRKRFIHMQLAFNYRMTNFQAALGLAQLEIVEKLLVKKRRIAYYYTQFLKHQEGLQLPAELSWAKNSYWMYAVLVKKSPKISKSVLQAALADKHIGTRDFFVPMHQQPALLSLGLFKNDRYPVAEDISKRGMYLPSGPHINRSEIKTVCDIIQHQYERV